MKRSTTQRKRLILFVGHHKVGSTSLQDFLARNAPALARRGILYPFVDFQGMAYLSNQLRKGPIWTAGAQVRAGLAYLRGGRKALRDTDYHLPINVREPHNALAFRMMNVNDPKSMPGYHKGLPPLPQMEHAIRQQIAFSKPHTVVIAAEVLSNFAVVCPDKIDRLLALFPDFDVTLMATLRRVDEYLVSWQGQRLKFGHSLEPLFGGDLKGYKGTIHFDYRKMLEKWLLAVPDAKLVIRDYHDVRQSGGSVADFIAQSDLKMPMMLQRERRQNDSMHSGVYELVRRGNRELPRKRAGLFRTVLRDLSQGMTLPPSRDIEMFGAETRLKMAQHFAPVDDWLGTVTGRDGGFFAHQDEVTMVRPVPEAEVVPLALEQARKSWPTEGPASDLKPFLDRLTL